MKVLLSWLKEFAPIEGEPDAIGEQLSELGLAVEEITRTGEHLEGVVVAKVLDLRPHPDADRIQSSKLTVVTVNHYRFAVGHLICLLVISFHLQP